VPEMAKNGLLAFARCPKLGKFGSKWKINIEIKAEKGIENIRYWMHDC